MDNAKATGFSELVWGVIADAFKYSNECATIPPDRSLKDFFIEKVGEKGLTDDENRVVLQMAEMWGAFIGDPIDRQSLKNFYLEECIDGGRRTLINLEGSRDSTDIN